MKAVVLVSLIFCIPFHISCGQESTSYVWPDGKKMALSLTFDDARLSNVDVGVPLFNKYNAHATFFVVPSAVERRLEGWKKAVAAGHEIGNHSTNHPCTGNFLWSRKNALEDYTIEKMETELDETNKRIHQLLGVTPAVFAYPCGQKFVGRGVETRSYVPLIANMFLLGRGWLDEAPNDPAFCDLAQITGIEMDGKDFDQILPILESARSTGSWVVLAGHEIGEGGNQTTRVSMLEKLIQYAQNPDNGIWLAPAGVVAGYVKKKSDGK